MSHALACFGEVTCARITNHVEFAVASGYSRSTPNFPGPRFDVNSVCARRDDTKAITIPIGRGDAGLAQTFFDSHIVASPLSASKRRSSDRSSHDHQWRI